MTHSESLLSSADGVSASVDEQPTYYDLLEITPDVSPDDITDAYRRQLDRYDPAHATTLGPEFVHIAEERRAALERAYAVLGDREQRAAYNQRFGFAPVEVEERRRISNREVLYAIGGIIVGILVLAGLWSALGRGTPQSSLITEVNYPAPPFTLQTLDGGTFNLADHRGKVVLVNFWGTWCEPCKQETPALVAANDKLAKEGLVIVGVDLFDAEIAQGKTREEGQAAVQRFITEYGGTYPIALDETGQVARDYRLYPIPVSYFVDRNGTVRYIRVGGLTTQDVEEIFRKM